jgi:tetratricopeptide (TPR) repeat protein
LAKKKRIKKLSKRRLLKEPDEFVSTWNKIYIYISEHTNIFYIVLSAIIALAIAFSILSFVYFDRKKDAAGIFEKGMYTYQNSRGFTDELEDSLASFDTIIKKYPLSDVRDLAFLYRGNVLYDLERYDEAASSYKKAEKKIGEPLSEIATTNLGYTYDKMGEYDKAAEAFLKVLDNDDEESYLNLIWALKNAGREDEAEKYAETLSGLFPESSGLDILDEEPENTEE